MRAAAYPIHPGFLLNLLRAYFFNVLNTLNPEYMSGVIKHANSLRNRVVQEEQVMNSIEISPAWLDQLNEVPFTSCK